MFRLGILTDSKAENASRQKISCLNLVHTLDRFSSRLVGNLRWFTSSGDTGSIGTVLACGVICLAHLSALCHLMSQTDPASSLSMSSLYDLTLDNLGDLTLKVHIEEYSHLDLLIAVRISQLFVSSNEVGTLPNDSS